MEHHSDMVNIEHNESDVYLYDISSTEILLGKRLERERIIALLEQLIGEPSDDLTYRVNRNDALCQAIALIKGENK